MSPVASFQGGSDKLFNGHGTNNDQVDSSAELLNWAPVKCQTLATNQEEEDRTRPNRSPKKIQNVCKECLANFGHHHRVSFGLFNGRKSAHRLQVINPLSGGQNPGTRTLIFSLAEWMAQKSPNFIFTTKMVFPKS